MATERVLSNLNLISFKTEGGLQNHIDELQDGDLAFTPDNSLKGVLFDFKWADHLLNDISWLRADMFSWQSGDVYVAAYNHLVTDFENAEVNHWYAWAEIGGGIWYTKTPTVAVGDTVYNDDFSVFGQVDTVYSGTNFTIGANDFNRSASNDITVGDTETIAGIEITYYRAEDGHKICLPDQEDKVLALYNATGVAWYYILDTANKQFKLPRSKHNKYADTLGVVGNGSSLGIYDGTTTKNLISGRAFTNQDRQGLFNTATYSDTALPTTGTESAFGGNALLGITTDPEKSGIIAQQIQDTDQYKYLYFYVGNFERDALEQTAGVTAETLSGKADSDLGNIPANYDYVVESQMPTAENGYTWYRKYKSGWVEQGGINTSSGAPSGYITLIIPMRSTDYWVISQWRGSSAADTGAAKSNYNYAEPYSTTQILVGCYNTTNPCVWQVSGMSA